MAGLSNDTDTKSGAAVVVISENIAQSLFGTKDVIGRELNFQRRQWAGEREHPVESARIIGIAASSETSQIGQRDHGVIYLPFSQHYEGRLVLAVHTNGKPETILSRCANP